MNKATVRVRQYIGQFKCMDAYREVMYKYKQLIGSLWYLYNQSGYVIGTFATEDITFE